MMAKGNSLSVEPKNLGQFCSDFLLRHGNFDPAVPAVFFSVAEFKFSRVDDIFLGTFLEPDNDVLKE